MSTENYKINAHYHRRFQEFLEGDLVVTRLRSERFPTGTMKKLVARNAGPFKILKKISANAYVSDLSSNLSMSSTFNVSDLILYKNLL